MRVNRTALLIVGRRRRQVQPGSVRGQPSGLSEPCYAARVTYALRSPPSHTNTKSYIWTSRQPDIGN